MAAPGRKTIGCQTRKIQLNNRHFPEKRKALVVKEWEKINYVILITEKTDPFVKDAVTSQRHVFVNSLFLPVQICKTSQLRSSNLYWLPWEKKWRSFPNLANQPSSPSLTTTPNSHQPHRRTGLIENVSDKDFIGLWMSWNSSYQAEMYC